MSKTITTKLAFGCDQCDQSFVTDRGRKAHVTRSHKKVKRAVSPARRNGVTFQAGLQDWTEIVHKTTRTFFPKGVPANRVMEVAEWQKTTLAMLSPTKEKK